MFTLPARSLTAKQTFCTLVLSLVFTGCQRQQQTETGKIYTADKGAGGQQQQTGRAQQSGPATTGSAHGQPNGGKPQGGTTSGGNGATGGGGASGGGSQTGGQSGSNESDAKPLSAPADTANGKASVASDSGTAEATRGQVVSQPGAPPQHKPH